MPSEAILDIRPLGFVWDTADPFLFCVHHEDFYPAGNAALGPSASLAGRNLGQDFEGKDGWRMYHGEQVPGFPSHPHRGFETVTIVRKGLIDHSDSLGATARFGQGDVQWLTAGAGIVHSEMFPLLDPSGPNTVELFQIWLNLPRADKMAPPHFSMLWAPTIPHETVRDEQGLETHVSVVAGTYEGHKAPAPPPRSWASRAEADVAIWTLRMAPNATFTLPSVAEETLRTLYFFRGGSLRIAGERMPPPKVGVLLRPGVAVTIDNGPEESELLLLQGRPIGEPVAQHGPFVMNSAAEIRQAFADYQRTQFGGWPFDRHDPVHPRTQGRFARHADGRVEEGPA